MDEKFVCPSCKLDISQIKGKSGIELFTCTSCNSTFPVMYIAGFNDGLKAGA